MTCLRLSRTFKKCTKSGDFVELGRILLFELTRHSDHHYKSTRKYQILRHMDDSLQLPLGYPGSMLLALIPPLWFAIINKKIVEGEELNLVLK